MNVLCSQILWKNKGHDHFLIFSPTVNHIVGVGVKRFLMNECVNCSVLSIESTSNNAPLRGRSRKYFYAMPYPSSFHHHEALRSPPWRFPSIEPRSITALFIGSVKTKTSYLNKVRRALFEQCSQHPQHCVWAATAHSCSGVSYCLHRHHDDEQDDNYDCGDHDGDIMTVMHVMCVCVCMCLS